MEDVGTVWLQSQPLAFAELPQARTIRVVLIVTFLDLLPELNRGRRSGPETASR